MKDKLEAVLYEGVSDELTFLEKIKGGTELKVDEILAWFKETENLYRNFDNGKEIFWYNNGNDRTNPWNFYTPTTLMRKYSQNKYMAKVKDYDKRVSIAKVLTDYCDISSSLDFKPDKPKGILKNGKLNTWVGFTIDDTEAVVNEEVIWGAFKDLVELTYNEDGDIAGYVMSYYGHILEKPAEKPTSSALSFMGDKGTFKSSVFDLVKKICGSAAFELSSPDQLTGRFNLHLSSRLLIGGSEVAFGGDKAATNRLKDIITNKSRSIEVKNGAVFEIADYSRLVLMTNNSFPIDVEANERRWTIIKTNSNMSDTYRRNNPESIEAKVGAAFIALILKGGDNALRIISKGLKNYYVNNRDKYDIHKPLSTQSKEELRVKSMTLLEEFFYELLTTKPELFGEQISAKKLYIYFTNWTDSNNSRRSWMTPTKMGSEFKMMSDSKRTSKGMVYTLPTQDILSKKLSITITTEPNGYDEEEGTINIFTNEGGEF